MLDEDELQFCFAPCDSETSPRVPLASR